MVKNLSAMRDTRVQSLGWEDPLEKEMAIHSSVLAWKNPMKGGAWQATVHGVAKSRTRMSDFIQGERHGELWPFERFLIGDSHTTLRFAE